MQLFYEILPVFLFFLAFKFYDIYVATMVGIVATLLQTIISRFWQGKWDKKQLVTLAAFLLFGGLTLYFHNPIFVKWKPTVIFWIFASVFLGYPFFSQKTLIQRLMENTMQGKTMIPGAVWKKLNFAWAAFFICLGAINLYIAYCFSNNVWVNFKFYGITSALLLFSVLQAFYLARYIAEVKN